MNQNPQSNPDSDGEDAATDDRFLSVEFLAYDLEVIAIRGRQGDCAQMQKALLELRAWRDQFNNRLGELELAISDFSSLDDLLT